MATGGPDKLRLILEMKDSQAQKEALTACSVEERRAFVQLYKEQQMAKVRQLQALQARQQQLTGAKDTILTTGGQTVTNRK